MIPRRISFVVLAVALVLTFPVIAASESTPSRDLGDKVDDALLGLEVKMTLLGKLGLDATGIEVEARDGRVVLTGDVERKPSRELATEVARSVEGVSKVDNRVALESPRPPSFEGGGEALDDAVLEVRVKHRLVAQIGKHAFQVEVEAADGVVSLRGEIPKDHREIAIETARTTDGVKKVVDLLQG